MFQTEILEQIKTRILFSFFENVAVYEMKWKNIVERGRPQMAVRGMRIAFWISKATNTHTQFL